MGMNEVQMIEEDSRLTMLVMMMTVAFREVESCFAGKSKLKHAQSVLWFVQSVM